MIEERILNRLADRLAAALAPPAVPLHRFVVDTAVVGAVTAERAVRLRAFPGTFVVDEHEVRLAPHLRSRDARSAALADIARTLADEGALTPWRDERYAVSPALDAPPLFDLERAAARYFGIQTYAVHVNGTTTRPDASVAMWIARRCPRKAIDPGLLDNLVGGGLATGSSVRGTLVKEAREEAGLDEATALQARPAGTLRIHRLQPDGVQRETIFAHDLHLPPEVVPHNEDGEVVAFHLAAPEEVARIASATDGPDVVTADASLVMADWLLRHRYLDATLPGAQRIRALSRMEAG
jgi:8-oxo-dGTP pyrophosphatase MutT (NUDIX family)